MSPFSIRKGIYMQLYTMSLGHQQINYSFSNLLNIPDADYSREIPITGG